MALAQNYRCPLALVPIYAEITHKLSKRRDFLRHEYSKKNVILAFAELIMGSRVCSANEANSSVKDGKIKYLAKG